MTRRATSSRKSRSDCQCGRKSTTRPATHAGSMGTSPSRSTRMSELAMHDSFGRRIEYLRISVTDKCNLRCVYCMPEEGLPWLKREQLLSYEEIARIVEVMAGMGLRRIRLTGGEPPVRRDLHTLVGPLARIPAN